jgi:hypothetical protein
MAALLAWECGSHLHEPQEFEVCIFMQPDLNMTQSRWLELIKDYELEVHYHLGKANIVVDMLSCKAHHNYLLAVPLIGEESNT